MHKKLVPLFPIAASILFPQQNFKLPIEVKKWIKAYAKMKKFSTPILDYFLTGSLSYRYKRILRCKLQSIKSIKSQKKIIVFIVHNTTWWDIHHFMVFLNATKLLIQTKNMPKKETSTVKQFFITISDTPPKIRNRNVNKLFGR